MPNTLINNFIRQLTEIQEGSLWFDQSLKQKLEHLTEATVFTKPLPAIHSVAEHVSHMLEWRKECIRRFSGSKYELMNSPEDWKDNEQLQKNGWPELKSSLYSSTQSMIALIEGKEDSYLDTIFQDTDYTFKYLIEGIIHHDIYHLGQIGVTLKLIDFTKSQSLS
jgi:uncharacterized damage-inducible protein DinB